jgi:hypothetical protein
VFNCHKSKTPVLKEDGKTPTTQFKEENPYIPEGINFGSDEDDYRIDDDPGSSNGCA